MSIFVVQILLVKLAYFPTFRVHFGRAGFSSLSFKRRIIPNQYRNKRELSFSSLSFKRRIIQNKRANSAENGFSSLSKNLIMKEIIDIQPL